MIAAAGDELREALSRVGRLPVNNGVYGDRSGGWVDEDYDWFRQRGRAVCVPRKSGRRSNCRSTSSARRDLWPGRGLFAKVKSGKARRIIKRGQVFSRIHVDDIASVLAASIARPSPGGSTMSVMTIPRRQRTSSPTRLSC